MDNMITITPMITANIRDNFAVFAIFVLLYPGSLPSMANRFAPSYILPFKSLSIIKLQVKIKSLINKFTKKSSPLRYKMSRITRTITLEQYHVKSMRYYSGILFVLLIITVIFAAGCTRQTSPAAPVPVPTLTATVTTTASPFSITTTPVIPTLTPAIATTTAVVSVTTLLPQADPTEVSEINFSYYSDSDFSVEYPSSWTTANSINTPYPVGPFFLYDDPRLTEPYRVVTITSPDTTKKFVSLTQDFEQAGDYSLNPTIDWCKAMFQRDYQDLSAANYLGNFKYFSTGNAMASSYDVTLPEGTRYYPSAYTIKAVAATRILFWIFY